MARENELNEPSDQAIDLGTRSGRIESIGEKGSEKPCWLGEANNGNVKRKKEISGKNIKLPSSKSLHLLREGNNMLNKTKHAKYTLDRLREYEKRLAIHGHFECYTNNNWVHFRVKHLHFRGNITKSLILAHNDEEEKSILERTKINILLDLYATMTKGGIKTSMSLLIVETLHREVIRVKKTLKKNALNGLQWPKRGCLTLMMTTSHQ